MISLEWYWKLERGELNLDTRYNIFFAGASLHFLHDNDSWGLSPPEDCINQYYDRLRFVNSTPRANRETFPITPNGVFSYRLISLNNSMKSIGISRQENRTESQPVTAANFKIHVYPFTDLPEIRSHMHQKFAIVELGRKLVQLDENTLSQLIHSLPILGRIHSIYIAWAWLSISPELVDVPNSWRERDVEPGQSATSTKTRRNSTRAKKRLRTNAAQMSPILSRPALGAEGAPALSRETLIMDREYTLGKAGWTRESLSSWTESVRQPVEPSGANEGVTV